MSMCNNKFVIICFDSNSQTSEPIRNPKSPTVNLEVEEQERSQGSPGTEEEGEQEPKNEDLDISKKRKTTSDVWAHFTRKKVKGKVEA